MSNINFIVTNFLFIGNKMFIEFNDERIRVFDPYLYFNDFKETPFINETINNIKNVNLIEGNLVWSTGYEICNDILFDESKRLDYVDINDNEKIKDKINDKNETKIKTFYYHY